MAGTPVGNGLMGLGCLIMLLPIMLILIFFAWAIHPILGIGLVAFVVLACIGAVGSQS